MAPKNRYNKVRIIAGKWRSRLIEFPDIDGLRPTHDRIRETAFNWLTSYITGASCLDLFAGSGAMGFEALSRGAKQVIFVDSNQKVIDSLREQAHILSADYAQFICSEYNKVLTDCKFDIVFLDPPFNKNLLKPAVEFLLSNELLNNNALVYFEAERSVDNFIVDGFEIYRHKQTSTLQYGLLKYSGKACLPRH